MSRSFIIILLGFISTVLSAQELNFYISPEGHNGSDGNSLSTAFRSVERAQQAIRKVKKSNSNPSAINVFLKGGDYHINQSLVFKPEDSGTEDMPVRYQSLPGEEARISGGKQITGWKKWKNGIWQAGIPEVKEGRWYFQQMWVNGETRFRARTPNSEFFRVVGFSKDESDKKYETARFKFTKGDINPKWTNLGDAGVIVYHFWIDSHLNIESVDDKNDIVTFRYEAGKQFSDAFKDAGARYLVENVFEGLDAPGEWYLNRKTGILYYYPVPGEDMNTAEVFAPLVDKLISFEGIPSEMKYVEYITFKNLGFSHNLFIPAKDNTNQSQGSAKVPGAISMTGTRFCTFQNCNISNIGTFVFEIGNGCTDNRFLKNTMTHLAGGGFRVNGGEFGSNPLERTGENIYSDNTIGYYGELYASSMGILFMNSFGNLISHNHIHHGFKNAIATGWVWGYMPSISRDNIIEYNHIHNIGFGPLSDGGAIYNLGISPGTKIRYNLIHDISAASYGGWGIYMDEGSSHILIENNVVYNTKHAAFNVHYGKEITVRNNIFALSLEDLLQRQRTDPHHSIFFEKNIMYWTHGKLLSNEWVDPPYKFHYTAKEPKTRDLTSTFYIDYNVYFNPGLGIDSVRFGKQTFSQWIERGKDTHSVYSDPMFIDPSNHDFRLKPGSPAFKLGFKQIDISSAGPREFED